MGHYIGYIGLLSIKTRIETLFNHRNENMDFLQLLHDIVIGRVNRRSYFGSDTCIKSHNNRRQRATEDTRFCRSLLEVTLRHRLHNDKYTL